MLPYIILSWICIFFCGLLLIYIPIDWFGSQMLKQKVFDFVQPRTETHWKLFLNVMGAIYTFVWIFYALVAGMHNTFHSCSHSKHIFIEMLTNFCNILFSFAAFAVYFTMVMQSLYESIKNAQGTLPTHHQGYNIKYASQPTDS